MRHQTGVRSAFAVVVAAVVLLGGQSVVPAHAAPTPTPSPSPTSAKMKNAKEQVAQLEDEASQVGEDYDAASQALEESKQRLAVLQADIAAQQTKVDALGEQVRAIALDQFRNREVDTTVQIFTSGDPETLLDRLSTASKVDDDINATLAAHEAEQANLTDMQRTAAAEVSALAAQEQKLAAMKKDLQDKVDAAQALVLQLTNEERAALDAAEGGSTTWSPNELDGVSANARALGAIKYATSKVRGGQYVWGSAGPTGFDCSGLMLAAYRSVGISLPHSSQAQSHVGRPVSRGELKPGDLIFWYHPIHHVGMYIGNGKIVHARNTRADLVIQSLASYPAPWAGARRVVG
ncbi:MAG TPA: NlpC/P60 family protein [Propionicimonas sp.]|uniref:C40 family peptidase n=1 Tax=Propionicimonas sp. TaxID=1955623 RepID=UPI002F3EA461